ncbi:hypothetical protein P171DRAFT_513158 [Karstenula rhodostoma CBS 690.94]|uniref:Uncharacterized protein n=1 Tax=Karstenula rhodostoma CBS 690.94 TaxID=1392251 RepID=A0A9P4PKQ2_9PLEO|nr:hypothetical protein P171DRAFT_513158 [Karstenula rhodostoma CBS 690.94]
MPLISVSRLFYPSAFAAGGTVVTSTLAAESCAGCVVLLFVEANSTRTAMKRAGTDDPTHRSLPDAEPRLPRTSVGLAPPPEFSRLRSACCVHMAYGICTPYRPQYLSGCVGRSISHLPPAVCAPQRVADGRLLAVWKTPRPQHAHHDARHQTLLHCACSLTLEIINYELLLLAHCVVP